MKEMGVVKERAFDDHASSPPLKVAILVPNLSGGGAEFVAAQWAGYLAEQGHQATLLTTHGGGELPAGAGLVRLEARSFWSRARALRRHLASADYDVLVALMPHWNVLALLATRGLSREQRPAVVVSGRNMESALRRHLGLAYHTELALARLLYPFADAYIAVSHPVAAEAVSRHRIEMSRMWVVPNPSTAKINAAASATERSHDAIQGPPTVTLTVPARLVSQKRPVLAVETAARLAELGVLPTVEFFGTGPEQSAVDQAADRLGVAVRFRGWAPRWFEEAAPDAVVLLPSATEGCPNVLIEAAAVGIASVASSRALGSADAVIPHVTGVLCMGDDPADFAQAVRKAMRLTPVSAPAWLSRFTPQESGEALLHVLRTVTEAASGRPALAPRRAAR